MNKKGLTQFSVLIFTVFLLQGRLYAQTVINLSALNACPVGSFSLTAPTCGGASVAAPQTLTWQAVTGATKYTVIMDTIAALNSPAVKTTDVSTNSMVLSQFNLVKSTKYFWNVVAFQGTGTGQFVRASNGACNFTTDATWATLASEPTVIPNCFPNCGTQTVASASSSAGGPYETKVKFQDIVTIPGDFNNFMLTTTGEFYASGRNYYGEVGQATPPFPSTPEIGSPRKMTGVLGTILKVQGAGNKPGSSYGALSNNGRLYLGGNQQWGVLGNGVTAAYYLLTPIQVSAPSGLNIVDFAMSDLTTVILCDDGKAYIAGYIRIGSTTTVTGTYQSTFKLIASPTGVGAGFKYTKVWVSNESGTPTIFFEGNNGNYYVTGSNYLGRMGTADVVWTGDYSSGDYTYAQDPFVAANIHKVALPAGTVVSKFEVAIACTYVLTSTGQIYYMGEYSGVYSGLAANTDSDCAPLAVESGTTLLPAGRWKIVKLPQLIATPIGVTSFKDVSAIHGLAAFLTNTDEIYLFGRLSTIGGENTDNLINGYLFGYDVEVNTSVGGVLPKYLFHKHRIYDGILNKKKVNIKGFNWMFVIGGDDVLYGYGWDNNKVLSAGLSVGTATGSSINISVRPTVMLNGNNDPRNTNPEPK